MISSNLKNLFQKDWNQKENGYGACRQNAREFSHENDEPDSANLNKNLNYQMLISSRSDWNQEQSKKDILLGLKKMPLLPGSDPGDRAGAIVSGISRVGGSVLVRS